MDLPETLSRTKSELDRVSPSFCLAKWLQVTIHLQNGQTHSCHHPMTHKVPLDELARDPSALHNTAHKKSLRKMMLEGKRPAECEYCWRVEDTPGSHFSDRIVKSSDPWAKPELEKIAAMDPNENVNPTYLEVSFGNECNFRCSYCHPHISSSLWASFVKHGEYVGRPTLDDLRLNGLEPLRTENNPYVKAFWDWFPSLAPDLKVFRITGGEPLVNSNTFRVLDYIEDHPLPHLQLCINSNLGVPETHFRKFIDKVAALTASGKLKNFMLFTSMDTHGLQAEYLRTGLNYQQWLGRAHTFLKELPWSLVVMSTFTSLSVPSFPGLLEDMLELNKKNPSSGPLSAKRAVLDISHLTNPPYLSAWILNENWIERLKALSTHMESLAAAHIGAHGFYDYEIHKLKRVAAWAAHSTQTPGPSRETVRAQFARFTEQYEQREGDVFLNVFPEMEDFYLDCRAALERVPV